ncbi:MAG: tryptophan-rich sensory protein [Eubacteriaceae bacterium]|nr:tryptophan-rich sensory protein [Eubacteriaceae bacterium]
MDKNNDKNTLAAFAVCMAIPLALGGIVFLLIKDSVWIYEFLNKPRFAPDRKLFGPVWTALYALMGISSYMVWISTEDRMQSDALKVYALQLGVNLLWPIIFFNFRMYTLAFIEIIVLLALVIWMVVLFAGVNKKSAYLQIPYVLWSAFACVLNGAIVLLN